MIGVEELFASDYNQKYLNQIENQFPNMKNNTFQWNLSEPLEGISIKEIKLSKVDFPAPEGPINE